MTMHKLLVGRISQKKFNLLCEVSIFADSTESAMKKLKSQIGDCESLTVYPKGE
jgi:hypothetical protein